MQPMAMSEETLGRLMQKAVTGAFDERGASEATARVGRQKIR